MRKLIKFLTKLFVRKTEDQSFIELRDYLRKQTGYTYGQGIIHERMNAKTPEELAKGIKLHLATLEKEEIITPIIIRENKKFFRSYL
jgi:hypothetical protein